MPKVDYSARGEFFRASRSREGGEPLATEHKTKAELDIRAAAEEKFTLEVKLLATWEAQPHVSLYEPEAVNWVPDFQPGPYYIFFDDPDNCIFVVEKPWQLIVIFERTLRKGPYYITNRLTDYLITIDQNKIIHGQGTAEIWLRAGINRIYRLLEKPPAPITVTDIHVACFGRQLRLVCKLAGEPFTLVLDGCDTLEWRNRSHRPPQEVSLDYVYLSEIRSERHRVSLSSSQFRLLTHCETIQIERETISSTVAAHPLTPTPENRSAQ